MTNYIYEIYQKHKNISQAKLAENVRYWLKREDVKFIDKWIADLLNKSIVAARQNMKKGGSKLSFEETLKICTELDLDIEDLLEDN